MFASTAPSASADSVISAIINMGNNCSLSQEQVNTLLDKAFEQSPTIGIDENIKSTPTIQAIRLDNLSALRWLDNKNKSLQQTNATETDYLEINYRGPDQCTALMNSVCFSDNGSSSSESKDANNEKTQLYREMLRILVRNKAGCEDGSLQAIQHHNLWFLKNYIFIKTNQDETNSAAESYRFLDKICTQIIFGKLTIIQFWRKNIGEFVSIPYTKKVNLVRFTKNALTHLNEDELRLLSKLLIRMFSHVEARNNEDKTILNEHMLNNDLPKVRYILSALRIHHIAVELAVDNEQIQVPIAFIMRQFQRHLKRLELLPQQQQLAQQKMNDSLRKSFDFAIQAKSIAIIKQLLPYDPHYNIEEISQALRSDIEKEDKNALRIIALLRTHEENKPKLKNILKNIDALNFSAIHIDDSRYIAGYVKSSVVQKINSSSTVALRKHSEDENNSEHKDSDSDTEKSPSAEKHVRFVN